MGVTIEISDGMAEVIRSSLGEGETIREWVMEAITDRFHNMPTKSQVRPVVRQDMFDDFEGCGSNVSNK